ncbi:MAG: TetR/AcrR family transcriptional regulator [Treponema sp.]|jgi:AcrR family transcriptional regulator|nr:TetR/AcrR family transcriptional regulator [Treponema sp.]
MTRDDILNAAFKVWGRELYKTTSLAKLAQTLGVSKPALYRHFPDKEALLAAMYTSFYDDYAKIVKQAVEEALKSGGPADGPVWRERLLVIVRSVTAYFAQRFDHFIYALINIHQKLADKKDHRHLKDRPLFFEDEFAKRGICFADLAEGIPPGRHYQINARYPSILFMVGLTTLHGMALFHKRRRREGETGIVPCFPPGGESSEEEILSFAGSMVERVRLGLHFERAAIENLPYARLEGLINPDVPAPDALLRAVAEVVAETGPWNASMEMVAKRSGLSKSGLYFRFKSKQDMLARLFMEEFDRIAKITTSHIQLASAKEEQLYLAILSTAAYLHSRPEILIALDWIGIQRLELDISVPPSLRDFFEGLNLSGPPLGEFREGGGGEREQKDISQWILFLLIAILIRCLRYQNGHPPQEGDAAGLDYGGLRKLFRFITLGIEGFDEENP